MTDHTPFATIAVTTDSGPVTTPCEPINDWLAITPDLGRGHNGESVLVGGFVITHRTTGAALTDGAGCINCCRWAGSELAALDADWSTLTSDNTNDWLAALAEQSQRRFMEVRAVEWLCDADLCDRSPAGEVE